MKTKKITSRQVIKRLTAQKSDRQKITLYLSRKLYEQLKLNCGDFAPSQVIEELIREFLAGLK
jgi:hypothetical protein